RPLLDLHSCPTRRSSDLVVPREVACLLLQVIGEVAQRVSKLPAVFLGDSTRQADRLEVHALHDVAVLDRIVENLARLVIVEGVEDRKSTRLNSSHLVISY